MKTLFIFYGNCWFKFVSYNKFFDSLVCEGGDKKQVDIFPEDVVAYEDDDGNIYGPGVTNDLSLFI